MGKRKQIAGIYVIINIINNKKYVGHSKSIGIRWDNHKYHLRRNLSNNTHLQKAWNKYGEQFFTFSILESLPNNLSRQEYEKVETKWVLQFKTHLSEFGYNGVLPGTIPLYRKEENNIERNSKWVIFYKCIDPFGKVHDIQRIKNVCSLTGIKENVICDLAGYWKNTVKNKKRKSRGGWIIVPSELYNPEFDYINYKKSRRCKDGIKKTWKDYYTKEKHRKSLEDIIPYSERNLKRISILAKNVITEEEKIYPMMKDCYKEFSKKSIYKCINAEFGRYQHKGYYFKRIKIVDGK